jgi:hypothetical protein
MTDPKLLNKCPNCNGLAAVAAKPHCTKQPQCTWNLCNCGYTYDRHNGRQFKTDQLRPGTDQPR